MLISLYLSPVLEQAQRDAREHAALAKTWRDEKLLLSTQLSDAVHKGEALAADTSQTAEDKKMVEAALREECAALKAKLEEVKDGKARATADLDLCQHDKSELKGKLVDFKTQAEEAQQASARAEKALKDAQAALQAAQAQKLEFRAEIQALQSRADAGDVRVMSLEAELAKAQEALCQMEASLKERDESITELQSQVSAMKLDVEQRDRELDAAQERTVRQREEKNEAANKAKQEAKRALAREAELEASADMLAQSKQQVHELQDRIGALEEGLRSELKKHQDTAKELEKARVLLQAQIEQRTALENDHSLLQTSCQMLQHAMCKPAVGGKYGVGVTLKCEQAGANAPRASTNGEHTRNALTAVTVAAVASGSAASGKLTVGDRVLQIESTPVDADMSAEQAHALIAGALGTQVKIKVAAASGKTVTETLTRGMCAGNSVDALIARTPDACKALEDFVKEHGDTQKLLKTAQVRGRVKLSTKAERVATKFQSTTLQASLTSSESEAKKAAAQRQEELEKELAKLRKMQVCLVLSLPPPAPPPPLLPSLSQRCTRCRRIWRSSWHRRRHS